MMIRLRVALGKNVHRSVGWINPRTAEEYGISDGDVLIDADYCVSPIVVEFSELVRDGEIALPTTIMYRIGAYVGEERTFRKVEEPKEADDAVLFVVGDIMDWIDFYRQIDKIYAVLDDEIPISPRVSVRVIDIAGGEPGEVFVISKRTKIRLMFSGPTNLAIAIDASRSMLEVWDGVRKIDIVREISNVLLEYNLRKVQMCAIFSYAEDVDILMNWISIDPKLRWFMARLIPRFVTDMIIGRADRPNLCLALEKIVESFKRKNLGRKALNSILVIQAGESSVSEKKLKNIVSEFGEVSNGVWRTIWVGIGGSTFKGLETAARLFGGCLIRAKTPLGLIKRCRNFAEFRYVDRGWW